MEEKFSALVRFVFELFDRGWVLATCVMYARHGDLKKCMPNLGNSYMVLHASSPMRDGPELIPRQGPALAASLLARAVLPVTGTEFPGPIKHGSSRPSDTVAALWGRSSKGQIFFGPFNE